MSAPYLVEIRTGGDTKARLREIIHDVANRFDVRAVAEPRAVPHITLFGPYNTNKGYEVKQTIVDVLEGYDVVPYKIDGFDHFGNDVVYAKVVPSSELRQLRRELSSELRPLCYNYRSHDSDFYHDFHITVAFKDIDGRFDDILEYVNQRYNLQREEYATRITNLEKRSMMWEYDVVRDEVLSKQEATSADSWQKTNEALRKKTTPNDHEKLSPKPESVILRYKEIAKSKLRRKTVD
jgi:2'-5' RNA ligase